MELLVKPVCSYPTQPTSSQMNMSQRYPPTYLSYFDIIPFTWCTSQYHKFHLLIFVSMIQGVWQLCSDSTDPRPGVCHPTLWHCWSRGLWQVANIKTARNLRLATSGYVWLPTPTQTSSWSASASSTPTRTTTWGRSGCPRSRSTVAMRPSCSLALRSTSGQIRM